MCDNSCVVVVAWLFFVTHRHVHGFIQTKLFRNEMISNKSRWEGKGTRGREKKTVNLQYLCVFGYVEPIHRNERNVYRIQPNCTEMVSLRCVSSGELNQFDEVSKCLTWKKKLRFYFMKLTF